MNPVSYQPSSKWSQQWVRREAISPEEFFGVLSERLPSEL
jgi:hypothetical protein